MKDLIINSSASLEDLKEASRWLAKLDMSDDGSSSYWSNTELVSDSVCKCLIESGVRVFNRHPMYDCNGYPLQLFYYGKGDPYFHGFNMVELT